jgi:hypothetical protein
LIGWRDRVSSLFGTVEAHDFSAHLFKGAWRAAPASVATA